MSISYRPQLVRHYCWWCAVPDEPCAIHQICQECGGPKSGLGTEHSQFCSKFQAEKAFERAPQSKAQDRCGECGHQEHNRACLAEGPHRTRNGRQYGCYCPAIGGTNP